jgi:DNA-binding winged helix-turn-helix (wHTH) protein
MKVQDPGPVSFGAFEFDPASGELRHHRLRVRLAPHAVTLLRVLLEAPIDVRTREELQNRLWPGRLSLDFEHGLNKVVHTLRAALGDTGPNPRFIETISGQGYRFVHGSMQVNGGFRATSVSPSMHKPSLAVLPIQVWNVGSEETFFGRLLASALTDALTAIPGIRIIAQGTVRSYDFTGVTPQTAGRMMGADAVFSGEMAANKCELYVRMELIDVSDGTRLCAASIDRSGTDKCNPLDVAREIVSQLQSELAEHGALFSQNPADGNARGSAGHRLFSETRAAIAVPK